MSLKSLSLSIIALLVFACALPPQPNQYQAPLANDRPGQSAAVAELHSNARTALQRGAFEQAVDYLQRAIRIEPRNALSWHYLAESYWRSGDSDRCLQMVERSSSYSHSDNRLDKANQQLKARCQRA